jgi:hypothetical protein
MKIFRDAGLQDEVKLLDLGIVPAGDSKEFSFYLLNDSKADLRSLRFKVEHPEVRIKMAPEHLDSGQSAEFRLSWAPAVTLKEGLKAKVLIDGDELWK